ncbi:thrombopoietin isoform X2 [Numida meleagris]|uniref:thrombopoietin isoform X2 n=1 Tax=Numida meleagris TaxID=8996 RepID=UPI000B3E1A8E|nr:thrombopoietin isoform X2 [Numida meleagris]
MLVTSPQPFCTAGKSQLCPARTTSPGTSGRQDPSQPPKPPHALLPGNPSHHQTTQSSCCCRHHLSWGSLRRVARSPQVPLSFPGLLLLTSFLLHIKEGHARPMGLVCDKRLIQKYIGEAKDMEKRVSQCQALPALSCPVVLPLVDFNMRQWKSKSDEIKWHEILCNLVLLVGAVTEAQGQEGPWEPGCSPRSTEETQVTEIFLTYRQLVQGKLRFFFHNLAKDSCN